MTPKLPGLLVRHIQQKRCVVFVGAGLSAGAGLPTWGRLLLSGIQELVGALPEGELHQAELEQLVKQGKLLEVADFCKEKLGSAYHQFLSEQVRGDQAELPPTHDVLMRLPFSAWVTTNYDKLLERAYSQVKGGGFPKTLTHKDTEALGRLLFDGGPFILKAHGDIDRPETVVLTSRDYSDIIHANPAFNEIFSGLLLTKALLFVGYSLSDPDFRLLMDRQLAHFKGFVPERFALMTGVGPVERDVLWRTARIQVISYENASGTHAEVLQFLQALEAQLLPKRALESVQVRPSVPAPAAAQPQSGEIRSQTIISQNLRPGPDVPPGAKPSWGRTILESLMGEAQPEAPMPAPAPQARAPLPVPLAPRRLFIEPVEGKVQLRLIRGDAEPVVLGTAPTRLNEDVWYSLKQAMEQGAESSAWLYTHLTQRLFKEYLPREVLEALEEQGPSVQAPLVLHLAPEVAHFPWELLPLGGEAMSLKRRVIRAPVGVPDQVRGIPRLRPKPRILLIEGQGRAGASGAGELKRLKDLYPASSFTCTVLQGDEATFDRVMTELTSERDDELPDLVHYTGEIGQLDSELFWRLPGQMALSAGALRSVLSRGRLPFLVINAPCSAFAPYGLGVYHAKGHSHRLPVPTARAAVFEGHEGFMDLAAQQGVGAFVGTFDQPDASAGATLMVALHRALITGLPIADAVLQARKEVHTRFPRDPTALQYVLSGDGNLQLVDSQRE